MAAEWPTGGPDEFGPYLADQLRNPEVRAAHDAEIRSAARPVESPEDHVTTEHLTVGTTYDARDPSPIIHNPAAPMTSAAYREVQSRLLAELTATRPVITAARAWRDSLIGLMDDTSPEEDALADAVDALPPSPGFPADRPALDIAIRDQIAADALRWAADRIDPGPRASRPYPLDEQHDVMTATHHGTATNLRFWADQVLRGYIEPRPAGSTPPSLGSPPARAQDDGTLTRRCAHPGCPRTYRADVGPQERGWIRLRGLAVLCPDHAQDAAQPATIAVEPPTHPSEGHREGDTIPEAHRGAEAADAFIGILGPGEGVGRCGDVAPTWALRVGQPQPTCALPAGHAGWHRADDGCEWAEQAEGAPRPGQFCTRHFSWLCQSGQGRCQIERAATERAEG